MAREMVRHFFVTVAAGIVVAIFAHYILMDSSVSNKDTGQTHTVPEVKSTEFEFEQPATTTKQPLKAKPAKSAESRKTPKLFMGAKITYYRKRADGTKIIDALKAHNIPFETASEEKNRYEFPTNGLACAENTPMGAVKNLAKLLIEAGIPILSISLFRESWKKPKSLEIVSAPDVDLYGNLRELKVSPLSISQIEQMTRCPDPPLQN